MLFAKLFGARRDDDDEPTAQPLPPARVRSAPPAAMSASIPAPKPAEPASTTSADRNQATTGFDPYNSGAFKKSNAWERVNRR